MKFKNSKKGFTIIELIVVMAVIAILVLLGMPKFIGYTQRAKLTEIKSNIKQLENASERFYIENDYWPKASEEYYTKEELEEITSDIKNRTGYTVELDPEGKYYPIDYNLLQKYIQKPKNDVNYLLQNPVGEVFYVEGLKNKNELPVDDDSKENPPEETEPINPNLPIINKPNIPDLLYLPTNPTLPNIIKPVIPPLTDNTINYDWFLVTDDGEVYASDVLKSVSGPIDLIIPNEIRGIKVTSIKSYGFRYLNNINQVVIPEGVTYINAEGFYQSSIKYIQLPSTLKSIGDSAFQLSMLKTIEIPDTVTNLGSYVFQDCKNLTYVKLSNNLTSIPSYAFNATNNLSVLEIPASVTNFNNDVFRSWTSSQTVIIKSRNHKNFTVGNNWLGQAKVIFEDIDDYLCVDNDGAVYANVLFNNISGPIDLVIPNEINGIKTTKIKSYGFRYLNNINQVVIPEGVTSIDAEGFYQSSIKYIQLPSTLKSIGDYAFSTSTLTAIEIPDTVTNLGVSAFQDCKSLTYVKLSNNLTSISSYTFAATNNLSALEIPSNIIIINNEAFRSWTSSQTVVIKSRNNKNFTIGNNWLGQGKVIFENSKDYLCIDSNGAVYKNEVLPFVSERIDLVIPSEINGIKATSIKAYGFRYLYNINKVTIKEGITLIDVEAFYKSSINHIELPNTLETINDYAFALSSLNSIEIPINVISIKNYVFHDWTASKTIYLIGRTSTSGMTLGTNWNGSAIIAYK